MEKKDKTGTSIVYIHLEIDPPIELKIFRPVGNDVVLHYCIDENLAFRITIW